MKLADLNNTTNEAFLKLIGGPLEGEIWFVKRLVKYRPLTSVDELHKTIETVIINCSDDEKVRLIASHPDLAPSVDTKLSASSVREQASAGLNRLSQADIARFKKLNATYRQTFGFPFVICARENSKDTILGAFAERIKNKRPREIEIAIGEVLKIIRFRVDELLTDNNI